MIEPTISDVMSALFVLASKVERFDLEQQQQTSLLVALTSGVQAEGAKVDAAIAALSPPAAT